MEIKDIEKSIVSSEFVDQLSNSLESLSGHDIAKFGITHYETKNGQDLLSDNVRILEKLLARHFSVTPETIRDLAAPVYMHAIDKARTAVFLSLGRHL